ncbi:hypothetical protein AJ78_04728 [Emergomyces pasteurianus Ep9510]|uniref:Uncharacterized protein n=1 Tax=Emergomyces pasteurianus Ep9510 TaxID=1447872 RepID=A0A1J9QIF8_9EURO|nr:hypothetical protein AJ78_04728 [Emergomyces pasteurianus Ep9510]
MEGPPPPPPPPHGNPPGGGPPPSANGGYRKSTDLPEGPYDIFIVPPHSSGSGFIYLPSLQCHRNSFLAGVAATLLAVAIYVWVVPIMKTWVSTVAQSGGAGIFLVVIGVGVASWAWGRSQTDSSSGTTQTPPPRGTPRSPPSGGPQHEPPPSSGPNHNTGGGPHYQNFNGQYPGAGYGNGPNPGGQYNGGPFPGGQYSGGHRYTQGEGTPGGDGVPPPDPPPNTPPKPPEDTPKPKDQDWEKAREETKRKEDIRRKMEEFRKKREEEEKEKQRQREKEAREREFRERKEKREKERLAKEAEEKEAGEKAAKEKARAEAAARFAAAREAAAAKRAADKATTEKLAAEKLAAAKATAEQLAAEKRAASLKQAESAKAPLPPRTPSPQKKPPPFPSAKTELEDDAYSFRPYDRPKKQPSAPSVFSESSYAPSRSTARTTPPPSRRGPYSTKDPDKIIIAGVYVFNNTFMRTPIGQLVSGKGHVTDGLILRITTEGMFVDDDIRGVAQREWDVKAWTMKLVEVWCPQLGANPPPARPSPMKTNPFRFSSSYAHKVPSSEESDAYLANLHRTCKNQCRLGAASSGMGVRIGTSNSSIIDNGDLLQSAEFRGFHVVRASLRDQEGKKYVFVLQETEAWKVAIGLQRLKKGSQVRALGVCGLPANETNAILESLGYISN